MHHFGTVESSDLETDVLKQLTTFFMTSEFFWGNIYTKNNVVCLSKALIPTYKPTLPLQTYLQAYPSYPIDLGSEVNS